MKIHKQQRYKNLRKLITEEVRIALEEDYARGIPDFALSQSANAAIDDLRRHLKNHILQTCGDPVQQREKFAAANVVLEKMEEEMKSYMEEKLLEFMRMT